MKRLLEMVRSFRAMNTDIESIVCVPNEREEEGEQVLSRVERLFGEVERALSRFDPDSELHRLNARAGRHFAASPRLFEVVAASLNAARATGGIFDPTVLNSLVAAGYDRSFDELAGGNNGSPVLLRPGRYSWHDIVMDTYHSIIKMPEGCSLDLGGIGKGWTVDRASCELRAYPGFAIDAGGDIMVGGTRADGSPWTVGVADPFIPDHDLLVLELNRGAVATSTTARRQWQVAGSRRHHLIDPRTGKPAASGVVAATVTAESAVRAETTAKAALILGNDAGMEFIERQNGIQGLLVLSDSKCVSTAGFQEVQYAA